jgi:hypothetical protein
LIRFKDYAKRDLVVVIAGGAMLPAADWLTDKRQYRNTAKDEKILSKANVWPA